MQNFLEFSSVVDGVRSSAGSALKSVQRTFEESALKAAGLGEDEEVLYRLNKNAQAYLRAADAMQQAAERLAQDFTDALEDIALRDIARKYRETSGSIDTQRLSSLKAGFADPVRQACDAENYARRQQLVYKAFDHLLKVHSDTSSATGKLVGEVRDSAQKVFNTLEQPKAVGSSPVRTAPPPVSSSPDRPVKQTPPKSSPERSHNASTPAQSSSVEAKPRATTAPASFDDLLGDSSSSKVGKGTGDLLDFGFDDKPSAPASTTGTSGGYGTSSPLEHVSFDFDMSSNAKQPTTTPTAPAFDLGFDSFGMLNGTAPPNSAPPPAMSTPSNLGGLGDFSWPSKEDEDESCIKARVESWKQGKNLRTLLVTLHTVAPSSCGWAPVKLDDLQNAADVKAVYRKAMLAVHPDKNMGKSGEKLLAHFVFQALRDQWTVFNTSG